MRGIISILLFVFYFRRFSILSCYPQKSTFMIKVIFVTAPDVRDAFARTLSLQKKESAINGITAYQHMDWILLFSPDISFGSALKEVLEFYDPDRLYIPYFGRAITAIHEIGDVILPNVFFAFDPRITEIEIGADNRDDFLLEPRFLETFREQKDYYVEDYGLSIGGIVLENLPRDIDETYDDRLVLAYEADIYIHDSLQDTYDAAVIDDATTIITCGVVAGKK